MFQQAQVVVQATEAVAKAMAGKANKAAQVAVAKAIMAEMAAQATAAREATEVGLAMSLVMVEDLRCSKALVVMMHHWFQEAHITTEPLRISAFQAPAVLTSVKAQAQAVISNKETRTRLTSEADP